MTRRIVYLSMMRAAKLYYQDVEGLLWTLSVHADASNELLQWLQDHQHVATAASDVVLEGREGRQSRFWDFYRSEQTQEEPYRQVLVIVREMLERTIQISEALSNGKPAPQLEGAYFKTTEELTRPFKLMYESLVLTGNKLLARYRRYRLPLALVVCQLCSGTLWRTCRCRHARVGVTAHASLPSCARGSDSTLPECALAHASLPSRTQLQHTRRYGAGSIICVCDIRAGGCVM